MKLTAPELNSIATEAKRLGVPTAHLRAVVVVESAGVKSAGLPDARKSVIRWEGHYFDARLTGEHREAARKAKLASPKAGGIKNPSSQAARYALLQRAVDFLKSRGLPLDAAYESCSWGIGQVMGANWRDLGYRSAADFVAMVNSGFAGQLRVMVQFIVINGLVDELRDGRWASFARVYNGPAYAKQGYHTKLAKAAEQVGAVVAQPDGYLRVGSKGAKVRALQSLLVTAGYTVKIDSDFGPATRDALKAFQRQQKLTVDGIYGPQTERALAAYRAPEAQPGELRTVDIHKVKEGVVGGTGIAAGIVAAKEGLEEAVAQLAPYAANEFVASISGYFVAAAAIVSLAGLAYAGYGWLESKRTVEV